MATRNKHVTRSANGEKRSTNGEKIFEALGVLEKAPTGIKGLDEISEGGLPKGRTTIVCGGPGSGKTMLGLEFLIRGAREFNEPGVLIAFEESPEEMARNVVSLGFDLNELAKSKMIFLDHVHLERNEIEEIGSYDLEGLFVRLQFAIDSVGAKRVLLDTLEALFSYFSNAGVLRSEIHRLFRWLKDRGVTTVVTAEKGEGTLTRHGLEEYVSDCVILLDHRVTEQISTRRMRIVKYRGTSHGADEYPFLIDSHGLSVLPVTSLSLQHTVSKERVSSGIPALDQMLSDKGFYRGSTILIAGTAGTGKTTLASQFAEACCERGERCLYIGFEESGDQLFRNAASVGIELGKWEEKGLLFHRAWRPTQFGMEMHLLHIYQLIEEIKPQTVIIDPTTNLIGASTQRDTHAMLMRMADHLKGLGITALFTSLTKGGQSLENTNEDISSLVDTWILLRDIEQNGERNRCLYVLKSRGMSHSNQLREYIMTEHGIKLLPVYAGAGQVLTGSSRLAQDAKEQAEASERRQEIRRKEGILERKRKALIAQIEAIKAELAVEETQMGLLVQREEDREQRLALDRKDMATSRKVDLNDDQAAATGGTP